LGNTEKWSTYLTWFRACHKNRKEEITMILDKTIKFGYGSILVGCENGYVVIRHIEPPKEIGDSIKKEEVSELTILHTKRFSPDMDMIGFLKNLDKVSKEYPTTVYRGYTFDFSNFNPKSIDSVRPAFKVALSSYMSTLAC
jgi:hypothetical protein